MAKLNGVKTIDMVSGEITKVSHDGAEYVAVTGEVRPFDIVRINSDSITNTYDGDFFHTDSSGKYHDDSGYLRNPNYGELRENYDAFRKVSAEQSPTIDERVSKLEAEVADVVKIVRDYYDRQPYFCEFMDGSRAGYFGEEEIERYVEDIIEFDGAKYRKVEREAQAGDVFIINHNNGNLPYWFTVGKMYQAYESEGDIMVDADDGDDLDVYSMMYGRTTETVDVYEKVAEAKTVEAPYVPQEGDIVVVIANNTGSHNKIGDIGKVGEEKPLRDGGVRVYVPNGPTGGIRTLPKDIRKATPAEVATYGQAVAKSQFRIGDYVKIIKSDRGKEGTIVKITENGEGRKHRLRDGTLEPSDFVVNVDGDSQDYGVRCDQIVKATDDEVAKVKESAKWAKIGRQVNEYKAGDIIEYGRYGKFQTPPILRKVAKIDEEKVRYFCDRFGNETEWMPADSGSIRLTAPVESLV